MYESLIILTHKYGPPFYQSLIIWCKFPNHLAYKVLFKIYVIYPFIKTCLNLVSYHTIKTWKLWYLIMIYLVQGFIFSVNSRAIRPQFSLKSFTFYNDANNHWFIFFSNQDFPCNIRYFGEKVIYLTFIVLVNLVYVGMQIITDKIEPGSWTLY